MALTPDRDSQNLILGAYTLYLIAEANGGALPRTFDQYQRAARRFGVRIRLMPPGVLQGALLREGERVGEHGVIYVRDWPNAARLRREMLHELGEAATRWEGVCPCVCQVTRHEIARRVEEICIRRV